MTRDCVVSVFSERDVLIIRYRFGSLKHALSMAEHLHSPGSS